MSLFAVLTGLGMALFMLASLWLGLKYYFTNQRVNALENRLILAEEKILDFEDWRKEVNVDISQLENHVENLQNYAQYLKKDIIPDAYQTGIIECWEKIHMKGLSLRVGKEGMWVVNKMGDTVGYVINNHIEFFQHAALNFQ